MWSLTIGGRNRRFDCRTRVALLPRALKFRSNALICLFVFLIFFCTYVTCIFLADICQAYQPLIDGGRKHYFETVSSNCDYQLNGWYRFQGAAGPKMVTTCPPMNRCDANFPIWLNGSHPTVAEGTVTRNVCINKHGCCAVSFPIQVKNCSSYYIYMLGNLGHCDARYCTTD